MRCAVEMLVVILSIFSCPITARNACSPDQLSMIFLVLSRSFCGTQHLVHHVEVFLVTVIEAHRTRRPGAELPGYNRRNKEVGDLNHIRELAHAVCVNDQIGLQDYFLRCSSQFETAPFRTQEYWHCLQHQPWGHGLQPVQVLRWAARRRFFQ